MSSSLRLPLILLFITQALTEAGFDFIIKPVLPKDLVKKVREILDRGVNT